MPKAQTLRIAAGSPESLFSAVWRIVVDRGDVYLGSSKHTMGILKLSLHKSGVWTLAATKESGATFENGNRRAKQWNRPLEHVHGVTRGPSILVPHTSHGSRKLIPGDADKKVHWYRAPGQGELVEFTLYLIRPKTATSWAEGETVLETLEASDGHQVVVLAATRHASQEYLSTVERLLRENVFHADNLDGFGGGSFLWVTESTDHLKTPIINDLPVNVKQRPVTPAKDC